MSIAIQQTNTADDNAEKRITISSDIDAIVVVGTGPVGMQFVHELSSRKQDLPVVVYGSEPVQPYNRVRLSDYLAGELALEDLTIDESYSDYANIEYRYNCAVTWIDTKAKTITDDSGVKQHYSKLILATGSKPFMPVIGNRHYAGVYTFRTLGEADVLLSRQYRSRKTVVLGGGLLGLETARAMQKYHTDITIVEHSKWLMMQQLDEQGASYLQKYIEDTGIRVILDDSVISVEGKGRVEKVILRSGEQLDCDTLIIAAGIRPNILLARDAGLSCNKGLRINDALETSDRDIYAIGECAEHNNNVYGLVKPGFDQAAVLADRIAGGKSLYKGSISATQLKVMSQAVFSAGRHGVDEQSTTSISEYVYSDEENGCYRKIRVFGNRIIGAMAVGQWHECALINEAIQDRRKVWFWQLYRFRSTGNVWGDVDDVDVSAWPSTATVCNCTGISRGRLSNVIDSGCDTVECLIRMTRAGSVCGSCKPLLSEMIGTRVDIEPVRSWRGMLALSALAICLCVLFIFIWRIPYAGSVQHSIQWDLLWRDSLFKQITGFSILALFSVGLLISLRKRVSRMALGDFGVWRLAHIVLGIAALIMLVAHTGFRLGDELNFLLMINFLLIAVAGANASTVVATEHRMVPVTAKNQRKRWNWLHLMLFWPLPVLLGFHIFKTYYY